LGFQGLDPSTDFRSMGLLGLKNIVYFALNETKYIRLFCKRDYPMACTAINITKYLIDEMKDDVKESKILVFMQNEQSSDGFFHRCFKQNKCVIFEEIFCRFFKLFDYIWCSNNSSYMNFKSIMNSLDKILNGIFKKKPKSLEEFDIEMLSSLNKI
jgi:hypothetical protein